MFYWLFMLCSITQSHNKNHPLNPVTFQTCCKTVALLGFAEDKDWVKSIYYFILFYL